MGRLVMGRYVMGHFAMGRFVMGRFVCESTKRLAVAKNIPTNKTEVCTTYTVFSY
jgi:hypothetical protein